MDHQEEIEKNEQIGISDVEEDLPRTDHMAYPPDMEKLPDSDIQDRVIRAMEEYDYTRYTAADVKRALAKEYLGHRYGKKHPLLLARVHHYILYQAY